MKWIGQHIYDLTSRFRNDVYLESISSGTITSGGYLGLDSNNKIVKAASEGDITGITLTAGSGINITSVSGATGGAYAATLGVDVSDFMSNGVNYRLLTAVDAGAMQAEAYLTFRNSGNISRLSLLSNEDTGDLLTISTTTHGATTIKTVDDDAAAAHFEIEADGDITLDAAGSIYNEADAIYFTSTNTTDPILNIKNFVNDAHGARLRFTKDKGGVGADSDDIGTIEFFADNTAQELTNFASIVAEVSEADDTDEAGKLTLNVAESDGTTSSLSPGLILEGEHATDGQVDVTIGNGTASTTTIAGDLSITTGLTLDSVDITTVQTSSESFADNDTSLMTSAAIDDRINTADSSTHATVQTGKNYRIVNTSFRADIGTNKYYLPLKSQDEQTVLTREENQEVAVCDGRLVSLTWRAEAFNTHTGDATVTFAVETNTVGSSYSGGYSVQETEAVTVNHADDQHLWHVVFDSAKHWDSTDMFTISMQSDTDITGSNERIFITLVIEDDWSTYLAGSTREIDTTP
tara:strand:+ start:779 stop:2344 length:1566 start_codon:yes stop_codon:yes gene_type:complete